MLFYFVRKKISSLLSWNYINSLIASITSSWHRENEVSCRERRKKIRNVVRTLLYLVENNILCRHILSRQAHAFCHTNKFPFALEKLLLLVVALRIDNFFEKHADAEVPFVNFRRIMFSLKNGFCVFTLRRIKGRGMKTVERRGKKLKYDLECWQLSSFESKAKWSNGAAAITLHALLLFCRQTKHWN